MTDEREESFMKSLFHGVIAESIVCPYPSPSKDEQETLKLLLDNVREFCTTQVNPVLIDKEHTIPQQVLNGMKELGLFGMLIPEEYGGLGLSNTAYARVMQEVAAHDASLAVTLGAHQSIGLKGILLSGNPAQKKKYLPKLATGEHVAAFALTEPGAGSDAASISTRAELSPDGKYYILNGSKIWITNGGFAEVFTVFARTTEAGSNKPKITAFIVERGMGVRSGPPEHKLGIRGSSTNEVFFEDVKVPVENVLGEAGQGFKVAMSILNNGRLGLAAGCIGANKMLIKLAVDRVNERKAFGKTLGEFGMIKEKIASMMAETYALESMTYLTTSLIDRGVYDYSLESAICKVFGSEALWRCVNESFQIAAGIAYMTEYSYERHLRDARINMIFEGTNEILRAFIALSGMQGPGKQLSEVAKAMREPIKGFGLLSDFAVQKARTALGRERLASIHPALRKETVIFEEAVIGLARETERVLRKHGKDIAFRQFVQKRIAEVAMDLYALAAVLSRTTRVIEKQGEANSTKEITLTATFAAMAQNRLNDRLTRMDRDEDELMKEVAAQTYETGGYPYDAPLV